MFAVAGFTPAELTNNTHAYEPSFEYNYTDEFTLTPCKVIKRRKLDIVKPVFISQKAELAEELMVRLYELHNMVNESDDGLMSVHLEILDGIAQNILSMGIDKDKYLKNKREMFNATWENNFPTDDAFIKLHNACHDTLNCFLMPSL